MADAMTIMSCLDRYSLQAAVVEMRRDAQRQQRCAEMRRDTLFDVLEVQLLRFLGQHVAAGVPDHLESQSLLPQQRDHRRVREWLWGAGVLDSHCGGG